MRTLLGIVVVFSLLSATPGATAKDVFDRVEHHFADSDGVKIHYVTIGKGPVILFVHGFPDFWYSFRQQMDGLSDRFRCAAMDTRAYNRSGKPKGVESYSLDLLQSDVAAVIDALEVEKVILVGHDWGGFICWTFAMRYPERVDKLVIMNLFHPHPPVGEVSEEERAGGEYRNRFRQPGFHENFTAEGLARISSGPDEAVRRRYVTALKNSDFEGMLNYYQLTIRPFSEENQKLLAKQPNISMPVLQFHGLEDMAVHKDRLRDTWNWLERDYTLVTVPDVGHWVQRDAAELVTATIRWWLISRQEE